MSFKITLPWKEWCEETFHQFQVKKCVQDHCYLLVWQRFLVIMARGKLLICDTLYVHSEYQEQINKA